MNLFDTLQDTYGKNDQFHSCFRFSIFASALMCLFSCSCRASAQMQSSNKTQLFIESADFDPSIPTPESITGHAVAEKAVRYHELIRYMQTLAGRRSAA